MKLLWICALFGLLILVANGRLGGDSGVALEKSTGGRARFDTAGVLPQSRPELIPVAAGDADSPLTAAQYVLLHQSRDEFLPAAKLNASDALRN